MIRLSLRLQLALWYAGVAALSTVILTGAAWWLLQRSVTRAAESRLDLHFESVKAFSTSLASDMPLAEMQEEYGEYSGMSLGDAMLEAVMDDGTVLHRPAAPDWSAAVSTLPQDSQSRSVMLQGRPFQMRRALITARGRSLTVVVAIPTGAATDALAHTQRVGFWLLPLSVILAGLVGYIVSHRALQPIDAMTRDVRAIHVGSLDKRLEVPATDDELQRLAATFNDMLSGLERGVAEIARFTADASHELRTPVSVIRTTAEIALRRERSPEEYRAALHDIHTHAEQMGNLVGDLLVVARSEAGLEPHAADREPCDIRPIVTKEAERWRVRAAERELSLDVVVPAERVPVRVVPEQIQRLVRILIDNAIRYTPEHGHVRVALAATPTGAMLSVSDDGVGISAADKPDVFRRFYRGSEARARSADGHGLGLSIAKSIVERHDGTLTVQSPVGDNPARPGTAMIVEL